MGRGLPRGAAMRRLATSGERVTLTNRDVDVDPTTEWNDETVAASSIALDGVVDRGRSASAVRAEDGDDVQADAYLYVHEADLDRLGPFEIRDYDDDKTEVTLADGTEWVVVSDHLTNANYHEVALRRV